MPRPVRPRPPNSPPSAIGVARWTEHHARRRRLSRQRLKRVELFVVHPRVEREPTFAEQRVASAPRRILKQRRAPCKVVNRFARMRRDHVAHASEPSAGCSVCVQHLAKVRGLQVPRADDRADDFAARVDLIEPSGLADDIHVRLALPTRLGRGRCLEAATRVGPSRFEGPPAGRGSRRIRPGPRNRSAASASPCAPRSRAAWGSNREASRLRSLLGASCAGPIGVRARRGSGRTQPRPPHSRPKRG